MRDNTMPSFVGGTKQLLIGGRWQPAASGRTLDVINPATEQSIAKLAQGDATDIDAAVRAARAAFVGAWSRWTPYDRQRLLLRIHDLVDKHFDELALIETLDMGAPLARTKALRQWTSQVILFYGSQTAVGGTETPRHSLPGQMLTLTHKAPIGVVGGIIPWNAPLISQWWILGPALATGCTVVLKPAEDASLSVLRMAELLLEAGVPEGVINVVTGLGAEAGAALAAHPDVDRVAFTGSVQTAQKIVAASAGNMKRLQLELGGKSPDIVFDDADLDLAVPGAAMGVFGNSGQMCVAGGRLFVQRSIHDAFVERLDAFGRTLKVGNGLDDGVQLGPLISARQLQKVMRYMDIGTSEGAHLSSGGHRPRGCTGTGVFRPAHGLHGRAQRHDHRSRRNLRSCDFRHPLRQRGRSLAPGQRHALRPRRRRVDAQPGKGAPGLARDQGGNGLGELLRPAGSERRLRWLQDERLRVEGQQRACGEFPVPQGRLPQRGVTNVSPTTMDTAESAPCGTVHLQHDTDGVAWITLDNPARMNAMSLAMWRTLGESLARLQDDPTVRCCVLQGRGSKAFCAGADIGQMDRMRAGDDDSAEYDAVTKGTLARLHAFTKPIVAMVSGYCMGAGVALAAACDLRIATTDARFAIPSAKLGIAYYHQGVQRLRDLVGPAHAARMLFTGERCSAEHMMRIGFVDEVHPAQEVSACVEALVRTIAMNAPLSIAAAKLALRTSGGADPACTALEQLCAQSQDHAEGRLAFKEKRAPVFRGA